MKDAAELKRRLYEAPFLLSEPSASSDKDVSALAVAFDTEMYKRAFGKSLRVYAGHVPDLRLMIALFAGRLGQVERVRNQYRHQYVEGVIDS